MSEDPAIKSIADALLKQREQITKKEEEVLENQKQYSESLNYIASLPEGRYVLRRLLRFCRVYDVGSLSPQALLVDEGKRSVYLKMVRAFLDQDNLDNIERRG